MPIGETPANTPTDDTNTPVGKAPAPEETQAASPDGTPTGTTANESIEIRTEMSPEKRALSVGAWSGAASAVACAAGALAGLPFFVSAPVAFALAGGIGFALSRKLFVTHDRDAHEKRASLERTLEKVVEPRRKISFDSLLAYADDPRLGRTAQLLHQAMTQTHHHRLEAGWLRREMDTIADSKAREQTQELRKEATTDPLTGLVNRRGFEQSFGDLFIRSRRRGTEMALLAIDLDKFKNLNDTHGHAMGDEALIAAGEALHAHVRETDVAARIGGDELFLVIFETTREEARSVAQRVAEAFSTHKMSRKLGNDWPTMSIGVALAQLDKAEDERELFRLADEALYASKGAGRNCVTLYAEMARKRASTKAA